MSALPLLGGGLANGAVYALLALALVLGFRVSRAVDFSLGASATLATYTAFSIREVGSAVAIVTALGVGGALGVVTERLVTRAGRVGHEAQVLVTVSLYLLLDGLVGLLFGASPRAFELPGLSSMASDELRLAVVAGLGLALGLAGRSRAGLTTRVIAEDPQAAARLGLPVARTRALAWALAGALGALAGLLTAPRTLLEPGFLFGPLLSAFAAAVLGGFTSAPRTLAAALALGVAEALAGAFGPPSAQALLPLGLVFFALLARPEGLLARPATPRRL